MLVTFCCKCVCEGTDRSYSCFCVDIFLPTLTSHLVHTIKMSKLVRHWCLLLLCRGSYTSPSARGQWIRDNHIICG